MMMEQNLAALAHLPMPETKGDLLVRIPPARAALEALIGQLDAVQLTTAGPEGWAVKDHLVHISTWERMIVAHLRDGSDHCVVGLDAAQYLAMTLEDLNDHIYQQ